MKATKAVMLILTLALLVLSIYSTFFMEPETRKDTKLTKKTVPSIIAGALIVFTIYFNINKYLERPGDGFWIMMTIITLASILIIGIGLIETIYTKQ